MAKQKKSGILPMNVKGFPEMTVKNPFSKTNEKIDVKKNLDETFFKNNCTSSEDILVTYNMLPQLSLYVMEQIFYVFIFSIFLIEIALLARYFIKLKTIFGTEVALGELALLLLVSFTFFVVSFFIIPGMIQSCAERLDGGPYKIILVRILNLAMVSAFYYQFFEVVKTEIKLRIAKLTKAGSKILAHAKSDKFKSDREKVISDLLQINYSKFICDKGKPIQGLEDVLSEEAYKQVEETCTSGQVTTKQKKGILAYFGF